MDRLREIGLGGRAGGCAGGSTGSGGPSNRSARSARSARVSTRPVSDRAGLEAAVVVRPRWGSSASPRRRRGEPAMRYGVRRFCNPILPFLMLVLGWCKTGVEA